MRIAFVPSAFHPDVGGVEELTRNLAGQARRRGDDVEVWTSATGQATSDHVVDGLMVRRLPLTLPPARLAPLARFPADGTRGLAATFGAARRFRPDVVHIQCFSVPGAYATAVAALRRTPLVVSLQGETVMDDHDIFERSRALRAALRGALRRADAVTGCSAFVLDDAMRFGLDRRKARVVFNGVDPGEGALAEGSPATRRTVAALGRVVDKKGFDLLLDAFALVHVDEPDVELVIAGDGPALAGLEGQAGRLGLDGVVRFPGRLGRAGVATLLQRAEVFVLPSRVEPFGIVTLEAWRAGCAVVVSSCGGAPEFVRDGIDGVVVDPTDPAAMAGAILRLLQDEVLARSVAASGRHRVGEFGWDRISAQYHDLYADVLGGRGLAAVG